jgi:hypothetical protein
MLIQKIAHAWVDDAEAFWNLNMMTMTWKKDGLL